MVDISDLQSKVAEFVRDHNLETSVEARLLDLVSEVGELSKEVLKGSGYGKEEFSSSTEWESELGDVFFSLVALANLTDVDMEKSLNEALEKYRERIESSGDSGSGE